jgi:enamine deaminase RidA (YjgF/YER057c/UK114 family)
MQTTQYNWPELGVRAEVSFFSPNLPANAGEVSEYHVMLHVESRGELFSGQSDRLLKAGERLLQTDAFRGTQLVFRRFFLSDAANQADALPKDAATSCIQQPPLDGSKIAEWMYLVRGAEVSEQDGFVTVSHGGYTHLYKGRLQCPEGDSYAQTQTLLQAYEDSLTQFGARFADNCLRTWFFVRDVDTHYAGLVKARKENFREQGLTEHTHFIASTGIGGVPEKPGAIVQLGTYALTGFEAGQVRHLQALSHMSPTALYGVTFERATAVEYGDRAQILVSGTASIDAEGKVMYEGDIVRQTERMWENVECLLHEGNAGFEDLAQIVVYLRDPADYAVVKEMFDRQFPSVPKVIPLAPICRPSWLIEMECMAVTKRNNEKFRKY